MPRVYKVTNAEGTITTQTEGNKDIISIQPADEKPVRLIGWILGRTTMTMDVWEESLRFTLNRFTGPWVAGSGGGVRTPTVRRTGDPAASAIVRMDDATVMQPFFIEPETGVREILGEFSWNVRDNPWEYFIPEHLRDIVVASPDARPEALSFTQESTVEMNYAVTWTFFFEEL